MKESLFKKPRKEREQNIKIKKDGNRWLMSHQLKGKCIAEEVVEEVTQELYQMMKTK